MSPSYKLSTVQQSLTNSIISNVRSIFLQSVFPTVAFGFIHLRFLICVYTEDIDVSRTQEIHGSWIQSCAWIWNQISFFKITTELVLWHSFYTVR
jgi:hypothetical protein